MAWALRRLHNGLHQLLWSMRVLTEPVREGTFASTDRHERDRRAKFGKRDEPAPAQTTSKKAKKKAAT
jgi:hypothetical protein